MQAIPRGGIAAPARLLTVKKSNKAMKGRIFKELHDFFNDLKENHGEPHVTKVVRTTTGIALRNDDKIVKLPSCFSKRQ